MTFPIDFSNLPVFSCCVPDTSCVYLYQIPIVSWWSSSGSVMFGIFTFTSFVSLPSCSFTCVSAICCCPSSILTVSIMTSLTVGSCLYILKSIPISSSLTFSGLLYL